MSNEPKVNSTSISNITSGVSIQSSIDPVENFVDDLLQDSVNIEKEKFSLFNEKILDRIDDEIEVAKVDERSEACDSCDNKEFCFVIRARIESLGSFDKLGKYKSDVGENLVYVFCDSCIDMYVDKEAKRQVEVESNIKNS